MPSFLYFIPFESIGNRQTVEPSDFQKLGLAHALKPGVGIQSTVIDMGPGGHSGLLASLADPSGSALKFQPERQQWRSGPCGKYHVGMFNDDKPGPSDLARTNLCEGQAVVLRDGGRWIIPRCHGLLPDRQASLPYLIDMADDGHTLIATAHPEFEDISRRAFDFWLSFTQNQNAPKLTNTQLTELALDALRVNYRAGRLEAVGLLQLIGDTERDRILRAIIDADEIEAYFRAENATQSAGQKKDATSAVSASVTTSGVQA